MRAKSTTFRTLYVRMCASTESGRYRLSDGRSRRFFFGTGDTHGKVAVVVVGDDFFALSLPLSVVAVSAVVVAVFVFVVVAVAVVVVVVVVDVDVAVVVDDDDNIGDNDVAVVPLQLSPLVWCSMPTSDDSGRRFFSM